MNRGTIGNLASLVAVLMSLAIARPIRAQQEQPLSTEEQLAVLAVLRAAYIDNIALIGPCKGTAVIEEMILREYDGAGPLRNEVEDPTLYPLKEYNSIDISFWSYPDQWAYQWTYRLTDRNYISIPLNLPVEVSDRLKHHDERAYVSADRYVRRFVTPGVQPDSDHPRAADIEGKPIIPFIEVLARDEADSRKSADAFDPISFLSEFGDSDTALWRFDAFLSVTEETPSLIGDFLTISRIESFAGGGEVYKMYCRVPDAETGELYEETYLFEADSGYNMTQKASQLDGAPMKLWEATYEAQGNSWVPSVVHVVRYDTNAPGAKVFERTTTFGLFESDAAIAPEMFSFRGLHPDAPCIAVVDHIERNAFLWMEGMAAEYDPAADFILNPSFIPIPLGYAVLWDEAGGF